VLQTILIRLQRVLLLSRHITGQCWTRSIFHQVFFVLPTQILYQTKWFSFRWGSIEQYWSLPVLPLLFSLTHFHNRGRDIQIPILPQYSNSRGGQCFSPQPWIPAVSNAHVKRWNKVRVEEIDWFQGRLIIGCWRTKTAFRKFKHLSEFGSEVIEFRLVVCSRYSELDSYKQIVYFKDGTGS